MKNQNTQNDLYETYEENVNAASRLLSESTSAFTDLYARQFQLGSDLMLGFFKAGWPSGKTGNPRGETLSGGFDVLQRNYDNIFGAAKRAMNAIADSYAGLFSASTGDNDLRNSVFNVYNRQARQMAEANQRFFKLFSQAFTETNKDLNGLYAILQKHAESNVKAGEEAIGQAIQLQSSLAGKSAKDMQQMMGEINNQLEALSRDNMSLWSAFMREAGQERAKAERNQAPPQGERRQAPSQGERKRERNNSNQKK